MLGSYSGTEGISQMFHYRVELVVDNTKNIKFEDLIGQVVTVETLVHDGARYINGIVNRLSRGPRGTTFTEYRAEIVPRLWLLTKTSKSRIFQQITVPDILKKIFGEHGLDTAFELQGTFEQRDYCVQYRESDFDFVSRMMEEEGMYYFFKHTADAHKMVLANTPQSHTDMPERSTLIYEEVTGGYREDERIDGWEKVQQLRSGKYTLWDHCFELPYKHLEATQTVLDSVQVGKVQHKLKLAGNDQLEVYDFPGAYAQRFDGISPSGGDQPANLQKIFQDNLRTAAIRMEQVTARALVINATSNYANLTAGHKFTLDRHYQDNGAYVLTSMHVYCTQGGNYRSSTSEAEESFKYQNQFTAIPLSVPFRPEQVTTKPMIHGTQTAVVVGPSGEEIFTDKYGRVKVQFHWDREGQADANSSCWVRVASNWAGRNWGFVSVPRIGMEVVVSFLEGDPDQPIIVGCVYNADNMPPHQLPDNKTWSGIKTRSSKDAASDNLNEIRFEDKKGSEYLFVHGEKDMEVRVKKDRKEWIGQDRHLIVVRDKHDEVQRDYSVKVGKDCKTEVAADQHLKISGKQAMEVAGSQSLKVTGNMMYNCGGNFSVEVSGTLYLKAPTIVIEGTTGVGLKCGGSFVTLNSGGVFIKGGQVHLNSAGSALSASAGSLVPPSAPTKPAEALTPQTTDKSGKAAAGTAAGAGGAGGGGGAKTSAASNAPTHNAAAAENKEKKSWIEGVLVDEADQPVPGEPYEVKLPDGTTVASGTTDEKGFFRVDHIDPGQCEITFPNLDKDAWEPS